jgi:hypothetical protein
MPLVLLVLSGLVLAATVVRSMKDEGKVGVWKTSALPGLFTGLGDDVHDDIKLGNPRRGYMKSRARKLQIQLVD